MNLLTNTNLAKLFKCSMRKTKSILRTKGFPAIKVSSQYYAEEDTLKHWLNTDLNNFKVDYSHV